jgi:hypothetical protein
MRKRQRKSYDKDGIHLILISTLIFADGPFFKPFKHSQSYRALSDIKHYTRKNLTTCRQYN